MRPWACEVYEYFWTRQRLKRFNDSKKTMDNDVDDDDNFLLELSVFLHLIDFKEYR